MFELGNNLREARQRRRIDLVVAEQDTKIRSKYLSALETEEFDVLPGPVFVRGFLRTYSRYLGLDPQLYVDEYNSRFGRFEEVEEPDSPVLGRPGLAMEHDRRGRRAMRSMVIATMVGIALLAWLGLRTEDGGPATVDQAESAATSTDDAPATGTTAQPGALKDAARSAVDEPAAGATTKPANETPTQPTQPR